MKNRRKFKRFYKNFEIIYSTKFTQGIKSTSTNISASGMCILSENRYEIETVIQAEFSIPVLDKNIITAGAIVWNNNFFIDNREFYQHGIKFLDINKADQNSIEKYITEMRS